VIQKDQTLTPVELEKIYKVGGMKYNPLTAGTNPALAPVLAKMKDAKERGNVKHKDEGEGTIDTNKEDNPDGTHTVTTIFTDSKGNITADITTYSADYGSIVSHSNVP
jgi:hypothetical protein